MMDLELLDDIRNKTMKSYFEFADSITPLSGEVRKLNDEILHLKRLLYTLDTFLSIDIARHYKSSIRNNKVNTDESDYRDGNGY